MSDRASGFEPVEVRQAVSCTDCGDFEMEKAFSGVTGTRGKREYDRLELPDECPVCGAEVEGEGGDATRSDSIQNQGEEQ